MELASENISLLNRAYLLIKLRWIAKVFVGTATYVSSNFLEIELQDIALYGIAVLLALYNLVCSTNSFEQAMLGRSIEMEPAWDYR